VDQIKSVARRRLKKNEAEEVSELRDNKVVMMMTILMAEVRYEEHRILY
jgi:hypothetical protein